MYDFSRTDKDTVGARDASSVMWNRMYSKEAFTPYDRFCVCRQLKATLEATGSRHMIIGHTPQVQTVFPSLPSECKTALAPASKWKKLLSFVEQLMECDLPSQHAILCQGDFDVQVTGANCECNGHVWRMDVGMSGGVLNAPPQVRTLAPVWLLFGLPCVNAMKQECCFWIIEMCMYILHACRS